MHVSGLTRFFYFLTQGYKIPAVSRSVATSSEWAESKGNGLTGGRPLAQRSAVEYGSCALSALHGHTATAPRAVTVEVVVAVSGVQGWQWWQWQLEDGEIYEAWGWRGVERGRVLELDIALCAYVPLSIFLPTPKVPPLTRDA